VSPNDFVSAHAQDAHSVVVSVQEVEAGIGIMGNDPSSSDASAMVSFDGVLSDAQSSFEKREQDAAVSGQAEGCGFERDRDVVSHRRVDDRR